MSRRTRAGVTLIEMIIVVALLGFAMAIALPRTNAARRQLLLQSAATQLHGDFVRARVEAVRRNVSVTVTKDSPTTYTIEFIGTRTLPEGTQFADSSATTFEFASFGPSAAGSKTFILELDSKTKRVFLSASGLARIE
jgi:type IV fimbrial biogenesis protein FimT